MRPAHDYIEEVLVAASLVFAGTTNLHQEINDRLWARREGACTLLVRRVDCRSTEEGSIPFRPYLLSKEEVTGSSPVVGSRDHFRRRK